MSETRLHFSDIKYVGTCLYQRAFEGLRSFFSTKAHKSRTQTVRTKPWILLTFVRALSFDQCSTFIERSVSGTMRIPLLIGRMCDSDLFSIIEHVQETFE